MRALSEQLPKWVLILGVSGLERFPEEKIDFQEKAIKGIAQQLGLRLACSIPGTTDREVMEALDGTKKEPYWKLRYKGDCHDIFFLSTLNRAPEFVDTMYAMLDKQRYPSSEMGVYIQPAQQGASCHCEFTFPFNPENQQEVIKIKGLLTEGSEMLLKQGAFFSRPYGIWADMAYGRDTQSTIVLKKIKGIFDPNNVMNPGKLCF